MKAIKAIARVLWDVALVVVPHLVMDGAGLSGIGLVSYGAWLAWHPAGFMVAGTLLIAVALLLARAWTRS